MTQVGQTEVPKVRKGRSRDTCDIHAGSQAQSDTCSAGFDRHADADDHGDGDEKESGDFDMPKIFYFCRHSSQLVAEASFLPR